MKKLFVFSALIIAMLSFIGCTEPTETILKLSEESKKEYKIVFHANGGNGTMESINIKAETSIVLPTNTFKRTDYYFIGWSTTEDGEVMFRNADIFQGLYSDITLYAIWQRNPIPEKSTVAFDSNGGNGVMEKLTVTVDSPMKLSANTFTREGYTFAGWAEEKDGTKKYDNQAEVVLKNDDGMILYAVWEPITYKIQFSSNLDESFNVAAPETITIYYDKAFKLPLLEDIDGQYYFKGWNTSADGKGENYSCNNEIKNLTSKNNTVLLLYARWSAEGEHIINYVLDGGTNDSNNQSSFHEEDYVYLYTPSHSNPNYSFAGWYDNNLFLGDSITEWNAYEKLSDVTLYAKWNKPTYKVTLVSKVDNENTVSVSVNATFDSNMPKIVIPYRDSDYSFGGYFTMENGLGKQYYTANGESTSVYDKEEDLTLYAYWIKNTFQYEVTFVANDDESSNVGVKITVTYNENMPDIEPSSSRNENYIFAGYFTGRNCQGEQYYTADGKALKKYELKSDLTLYAGWIKIYSITYILNGGTNDANNPDSYTALTETITLADATKNGYVFDGWYTDEACTEINKITQIEQGTIGNITLYADWIEAYTITYVLNGGTNDANNPDSYTALTETITLADATKNGHIFGGWYTDEACTKTNKVTQIEQGTTGNITLYAKWEITADCVVTAIESLSGEGSHNIAITGAITTDTISAIKNALQNNSSAMVNLDLSGTTGLTELPYEAFYYCNNLTSVTIPDSVTSIGDYAFYYCSSLTSVTIPDSVTSIGDSAFSDCNSLESVTIPDSVTTIGNYAFSGCSSLTSVTIPDSVTSIGYYAFYYCSSLTSVTIPDSVTSIGDSAFSWCSSLTRFDVSTNNTSFSSSADGKILYNKDKTTLIAYPSATGDVTIPNSVTTIDYGAFSGCSNLTNITIPDSVTTIGYYAFSYCSNLTNITIPDSVTTIGYYAFSYCSSLTSVIIPDSVTTIDDSTFYYCSSLTSVAIPDSVTSIGNNAFTDCKSLTSVTIGSSVISIGENAFRNCSSLTSITIPGSVTKIDSSTFFGCGNLTSVTFEDIKNWSVIINSGKKKKMNVKNADKNATNLTSDYCGNKWIKE